MRLRRWKLTILLLVAVGFPLHLAIHTSRHVGLAQAGGIPWVIEEGASNPHSDENTSGLAFSTADAPPADLVFPAAPAVASHGFLELDKVARLPSRSLTIFIPPED